MLRFACLAFLLLVGTVSAHDTWVETNSNIVRVGDAIYINLMLGNHGNDHRDFKIASKVAPDAIQTFEVRSPYGKKYDLIPDMADLGYAPKEGFYAARFVTGGRGLYVAAQAADKVLNFGRPHRVIRSAKTYFIASDSLDKVAKDQTGFDTPFGHKLELVAVNNPVMPMGPGTPIKVRLLFEGKPFAGQKVSFIPRGVTLKDGMDSEYERITDKAGEAAYTPKAGAYHLIVAHYRRETKGDGYEAVHYSATMTVLVPQICPCCGD